MLNFHKRKQAYKCYEGFPFISIQKNTSYKAVMHTNSKKPQKHSVL